MLLPREQRNSIWFKLLNQTITAIDTEKVNTETL